VANFAVAIQPLQLLLLRLQSESPGSTKVSAIAVTRRHNQEAFLYMTSRNKAANSSIEDTFTRLLRLGHAAAGRPFANMQQQSRLMEESEKALHAALTTGLPEQQLVAARILNYPATYGKWEIQHKQLVSRIANQPQRVRQAAAALSTAFSLVHARSLFEYLRESRTAQPRRRKLIAHFHGYNGYMQAVINEHAKYLSSTASLICLRHLGAHVLGHKAFGEPMEAYEQTYAEYFGAYCEWAVPERQDQDLEVANALQQQLKLDVLVARQRLLGTPLSAKSEH
jgi:hypothetical protein